MIDLSKINNTSFDLSQENINKAEKIYYVKDFLNVNDNPLSLSKDEIKTKLTEFSGSNIAKANTKIQGYVSNVQGALTTLSIAEKTTEAYRVVKPVVKKAVNVGGIWLNFANVGEIAQDVLQLIFRNTLGEGKKKLENFLNTLLNTPVMLSLGDEESGKVILDAIRALDDKIKASIADYFLNLSLNDYLALVRLTNKELTKNENKLNGNYFYTKTRETGLIGVANYNDYLYLIQEDRVEKVSPSTMFISTVLEKDNIIDFFPYGDDYYLAYRENNETKINKNNSFIGTISGDFLKFDNLNGEIIVVSSTEIRATDSLSVLETGNIKWLITHQENGLYYIKGNKVYLKESLIAPSTEIFLLDQGDINSIDFYDYLYLSTYEDNKAHIKKIVNEREFKGELFPDSGFSFYKKASNNKVYAYKNGSLVEIKKTGNTLYTETITSRLPGDIADIDVVEIEGGNYFITSVGQSIFVAKEGFLNNWEEKYIDFEELGINSGIISSIKVDTGNVYISSLKNLLKVGNKSSLITTPPSPLPDKLNWTNHTPPAQHPSLRVDDVFIGKVDIDKSNIVSFGQIIYKIYDKDTLSCGNKILYLGNKVVESNSNIYTFIKKDGKYYHSSLGEVFENGELLANLETDGIITGFVEIDNSIYFFTDKSFYKETGKTSFTVEVPSIFPLFEPCRLLADNNSLLIYDNRKVFNYNNKNKEIKDIFQVVKSGINKIQNTNNGSFLFNDVESFNQIQNIMGVDPTYENGYKINSHFEGGRGIAPFDTRTLIIREFPKRKTTIVEGMSEEFKIHFKSLMKEIPSAVLKTVLEEIVSDILANDKFEEGSNKEVIEFIREYLEETITSELTRIMEDNFSLSPEDTNGFIKKLLDRLSIRGVDDITKEFYFIAMEFVKDALEQTVYDLLSLDVLGHMWSYYERHKHEWGDSITTKINKYYLKEEEYTEIVDIAIDEEIRDSFNILMNTDLKNEVLSYISGKSGALGQADKETLKNKATSKIITPIDMMPSFSSWVDSISIASGTFYKPKVLFAFEDIIDKSSMDPIQWNELPTTINRETFSRLLNLLLGRVKEEMKAGLYFLINEDGVPCFSCVNSEEVYKGVRDKFMELLSGTKTYIAKELYDSTTFESVPVSYFVPSNIKTKVFLAKILDNQTDLYKKYITPFIDAIIDSSVEEYEEEIEV